MTANERESTRAPRVFFSLAKFQLAARPEEGAQVGFFGPKVTKIVKNMFFDFFRDRPESSENDAGRSGKRLGHVSEAFRVVSVVPEDFRENRKIL